MKFLENKKVINEITTLKRELLFDAEIERSRVTAQISKKKDTLAYYKSEGLTLLPKKVEREIEVLKGELKRLENEERQLKVLSNPKKLRKFAERFIPISIGLGFANYKDAFALSVGNGSGIGTQNALTTFAEEVLTQEQLNGMTNIIAEEVARNLMQEKFWVEIFKQVGTFFLANIFLMVILIMAIIRCVKIVKNKEIDRKSKTGKCISQLIFPVIFLFTSLK